MKGNLFTAAAIMAALAAAASKVEAENLFRTINAGRYKHRGKGRGGISPRFVDTHSRTLQDSGTTGRAATRRRKQLENTAGNPFKQLARQAVS